MVRWMSCRREGGGTVRRALLVGLWVLIAAAPGAPALAQGPPAAPAPRQPPAVFLGSVPRGEPTAEPLRLTILDVINRALENNLGLLLSDDARGRSEGARWRALGAMLPTINGRVSETRQLIDL